MLPHSSHNPVNGRLKFNQLTGVSFKIYLYFSIYEMVDPGNKKSGRVVLPEFMYRLQRQAGIAGKISVYALLAGFAGYKFSSFTRKQGCKTFLGQGSG
jgi:hypothetical protein